MRRISSAFLASLLALLLAGGGMLAAQEQEAPANDNGEAQPAEEARPAEEAQEEQPADDPARPEATEDQAEEERPLPPAIDDQRRDPREPRADERDPAERPALGIRLHPQAPGLIVQHVVPGSPAAEAGIQVGDQIVSMNDRQFADARAFVAAIHEMETGQEVTLQVQRAGQLQEVTTSLEDWQTVFAEERARDQQQPHTTLRPGFNGAPQQQLQQEVQMLRQQVNQLQQELQQLRQHVGAPDREATPARPEAAPPQPAPPAAPEAPAEPAPALEAPPEAPAPQENDENENDDEAEET